MNLQSLKSKGAQKADFEDIFARILSAGTADSQGVYTVKLISENITNMASRLIKELI